MNITSFLEPLSRCTLQKITHDAITARRSQIISGFCSSARDKVISAAQKGNESVQFKLSDEEGILVSEIHSQLIDLFPECSISWGAPHRTVVISWS
jgi:hypothetical protein